MIGPTLLHEAPETKARMQSMLDQINQDRQYQKEQKKYRDELQAEEK